MLQYETRPIGLAVTHRRGSLAMQYEFHLQDPSSPKTTYLFEAIVAATRNASSWRGMFAFATPNGVDILFGDDDVREFLKNGNMSLLVGMDAITTRATLERLKKLEAEHSSLTVRVFWNRTAGLFHPKLSHFTYPDGEKCLIVGSGNLTPGGLRQNVEGFSVVRAQQSERLSLNQWDRFLDTHAADIRPIDEDALKRAGENVFRRGPLPVEMADPGLCGIDVGDVEAQPLPAASADVDRVLVARIPAAGGRWHQAHFNEEVTDNFFHVTPNSDQRVYLTEVRSDGTLGAQEVRPCVMSESNRNRKIELRSHAGVPYPSKNTPIAVFRELQVRTCAYVMLMPGDKGYREMENLLSKSPQAGRGVQRAIVSVDDLRRAWGACPLLTAVVAAK